MHRSPLPLHSLVFAAALVSSACGDDGGATDAMVDSGLDTSVDTAVDTGTPDAGPPPDICDELDLARRPFDADATGTTFGSTAGDFTVQTTDGPFQLSEQWSGCETYVFLNYFAAPPGDQLWQSFSVRLFERSTRNARYFFTSYERDADAVAARIEQIRLNVEEGLASLPPEDAEFWRGRVHYVTTPLGEVEGSVGDLIRGRTSVEFAIGIDRAQRFDPVGSLSQVLGGGFVSNLGMAGWVSHYYEYRYSLDTRLEAETDVTIVPLVDEAAFTEREFDRSATMPDAEAMASFDTLEVDVELECHEGPGECSEWDRIAAVFVCTDATCDERRELVRWITPYSRPGRRRWAIDATPMLGLLAAGGAHDFRVMLGPGWEEATPRDVHINLRFSTRGAADRPISAELAFRGGNFDAAYNDAQVPFLFTPPAGTTRVELVTLISGHGQTDGDNCAEWCNHEHEMLVNGGSPRRISFAGMAGQAIGCAERAGEGVIPGQFGNWAPLRAGWCPGFPVEAIRTDVTEDVRLGAENEVTYAASFGGGAPRGGNIDLTTYVVYYR